MALFATISFLDCARLPSCSPTLHDLLWHLRRTRILLTMYTMESPCFHKYQERCFFLSFGDIEEWGMLSLETAP